MIYSIEGNVIIKGGQFLAVEVGGLAFRVFTKRKTAGAASLGAKAKLFCYLHVRENLLDLYGFEKQEELGFFELLISISGVGPKSALSIMDVDSLQNLVAAIKEGRPDLLTRASGVGRKTAERIVLELKNKVQSEESEAVVKKMESDADIAETLASLGYRKEQVKVALEKVDHTVVGLENRLKAALKILSGK